MPSEIVSSRYYRDLVVWAVLDRLIDKGAPLTAAASLDELRKLAQSATGDTRRRLESLAADPEFQNAVRYFTTHSRRSKRPKSNKEAELMELATLDIQSALAAVNSPPNKSNARMSVSPAENFSGELPASEEYIEGRVTKVLVNRYERDPKAREACLANHGYSCIVCAFDFSDHYGRIGERFIHVHHRHPLGLRRKEYQVDPAEDLVPVCPNCHAMLHSSEPPLTVDELKRIWADRHE